jgi:hypothetical protein
VMSSVGKPAKLPPAMAFMRVDLPESREEGKVEC